MLIKLKKKKTAKNKCGFGRIGKHNSLATYYNNVKEIYKSFGVQSWVGGIGKRTSLKNWRFSDLVGSSSMTEIPHPAHFSKI